MEMKEFQALVHNWEQCMFVQAHLNLESFLDAYNNKEEIAFLRNLVKSQVSEIHDISQAWEEILWQYCTDYSPAELDALNLIVSLIANKDENVSDFLSRKDFYILVKENQQKYLH